MKLSLTRAEARRIALAAQGFTGKKPGTVSLAPRPGERNGPSWRLCWGKVALDVLIHCGSLATTKGGNSNPCLRPFRMGDSGPAHKHAAAVPSRYSAGERNNVGIVGLTVRSGGIRRGTYRFSQEVVEALGIYVYRLIDPRNGETFYVGRGRGERVFQHASGSLGDSDESAADPKLERIREIRGSGMDVAHIIHRHDMSELSAKEVEAALIDAYPGLVNRVAGSGSRDRGTRHVSEIVHEYEAEEFIVDEPLILISVAQLWKVLGVYEAVRGVWRMKIERASQYNLVLAHVRGVVRGAYRPTRWMEWSPEHFPADWGPTNKIGFDGDDAEPDVWERYVGRRVPATYRKKGAQTPFRYLSPRYYVNKVSQTAGNPVHRESCGVLPEPKNRICLGEFMSVQSAITAAQKYRERVKACPYCHPDGHST